MLNRRGFIQSVAALAVAVPTTALASKKTVLTGPEAVDIIQQCGELKDKTVILDDPIHLVPYGSVSIENVKFIASPKYTSSQPMLNFSRANYPYNRGQVFSLYKCDFEGRPAESFTNIWNL